MKQQNLKEGFSKNTIINNKYIIDKKLGEGGMGITYLARSLVNDKRMVVLKTLKKKVQGNAYLEKHFRQEGEALGRINHEGVVKFLDEGDNDKTGLPFIVMEYVEGKTLSEVINREPMNLRKCADFVRQIAAALTAAHNAMVLHRDLKPDNIMVIERSYEDARIKLIDFGIAKVRESIVGKSTQGNVFAGTYQYASPEQIRNLEPDIRSEVFSFAVVVFEILTQTLAFNIPSGSEEPLHILEELHKRGVPSPKMFRPTLPSEVDYVFTKAMAFDPQKRYQTPLEFAHAFNLALEGKSEVGDPVIYELTIKQKVISKLIFMRRSLRIILPVLALILVVFLFIFLNREHPSSNSIKFQNLLSDLEEEQKPHFLKFSFEHPPYWKKIKDGEKNHFVNIGNFNSGDIPKEQLRIGWYSFIVAEKEDFQKYKRVFERVNKEFLSHLSDNRITPFGATNLGSGCPKAYELRFEAIKKEDSKIKVWGRALFFIPQSGSKDALFITLLATSVSSEIKIIEDVGKKGELTAIVNSFTCET